MELKHVVVRTCSTWAQAQAAKKLFSSCCCGYLCQSTLRIHSAIASWIHRYFDNVPTNFMIVNTDDRHMKNWRQFVKWMEDWGMKPKVRLIIHSTPHAYVLMLLLWAAHSRPQRPCFFWSAPRITTSDQVQHRKSAIYGLPVTLRIVRVKSNGLFWLVQPR